MPAHSFGSKELQEWYASSDHTEHKLVENLKALPPLPHEDCRRMGLPDGFSLREQYAKISANGVLVETQTKAVLNRWRALNPTLPSSIKAKDLLVFLAVHPLGDVLTEACEGLRPFQKKERSLLFSRRIFKAIARSVGMSHQSCKALSRLLHADIVDSYLTPTKDGRDYLHSLHVALNLLTRDGTKSGLGVQAFWALCVGVHQVTSGRQTFFEGADSTDGASSQKRIDELTVFLKQAADFKGLNDALTVLEYSVGKRNEKEESKVFPQLYNLAFHQNLIVHYSGREDGSGEWKNFTDRLFRTLEALGSNYWVSGFEKILGIKERPLGDEGMPASLHGTSSRSFIGLQATDFVMLPCCYATAYGLTYLSGEKVHQGLYGVNYHGVSFASGEKKNRALEYTTVVFQKGDPSEEIERYLKSDNPIVREDFLSLEKVKQWQETPHESIEDYAAFLPEYAHLLQALYYSRFAQRNQTLQRLGNTIKQYRTLEPKGSLVALLGDSFLKDISLWEHVKQTQAYQESMPQTEGGWERNSDLKKVLEDYEKGGHACLDALHAPLMSYDSGLVEQFLDNPFPVVWGINVPLRPADNGFESIWSGPAVLGKDIGNVYVPEEKRAEVQRLFDQHILRKKKPCVLSLETLQEDLLKQSALRHLKVEGSQSRSVVPSSRLLLDLQVPEEARGTKARFCHQWMRPLHN